MPQQTLTPDILTAALQGLEAQRNQIDSQIAEVTQLLRSGSKTTVSTAATTPAAAETPRRRRKKMSASARRRIAEAQKKRWAAFHKQAEQAPGSGKKPIAKAKGAKSATTPEAPARKRKLSAAGRQAIAEAARRRWAGLRKAQKRGAAE
jgi:hypothetical protein